MHSGFWRRSQAQAALRTDHQAWQKPEKEKATGARFFFLFDLSRNESKGEVKLFPNPSTYPQGFTNNVFSTFCRAAILFGTCNPAPPPPARPISPGAVPTKAFSFVRPQRLSVYRSPPSGLPQLPLKADTKRAFVPLRHFFLPRALSLASVRELRGCANNYIIAHPATCSVKCDCTRAHDAYATVNIPVAGFHWHITSCENEGAHCDHTSPADLFQVLQRTQFSTKGLRLTCTRFVIQLSAAYKGAIQAKSSIWEEKVNNEGRKQCCP